MFGLSSLKLRNRTTKSALTGREAGFSARVWDYTGLLDPVGVAQPPGELQVQAAQQGSLLRIHIRHASKPDGGVQLCGPEPVSGRDLATGWTKSGVNCRGVIESSNRGDAMAEILADRIKVDPNRCHGKPVIAGTRVMVRTVLGALAAGDSPERVAQAYGITEQDVRATIAFANQLVGDWDHVPVRG